MNGRSSGLAAVGWISAAHPPLCLAIPNRFIRPERPKPDRFSETCQVSCGDRPGRNPPGHMAAVGWISAVHPPLRLTVPNRDIRPQWSKPDRFRKPVRFVSAAIAKDSLASFNSPRQIAVPAFRCRPDQPLASPGGRLAVSAVERQRAFGHALNLGGCAALIHPTAYEAAFPACSHLTSHG